MWKPLTLVGNRHGNAISSALLSLNRLIGSPLTRLRVCTGPWVPGFRTSAASTLGRVKSILITNPSNWGGPVSVPSTATEVLGVSSGRVFMSITMSWYRGLWAFNHTKASLTRFLFTGKHAGGGALHGAETDEAVLLSGGFTRTMPSLLTGLGSALHTLDTSTGKLMVWPANAL